MRDAVRAVSDSKPKLAVLSFMMDESTFRLYPADEAPQDCQGRSVRNSISCWSGWQHVKDVIVTHRMVVP